MMSALGARVTEGVPINNPFSLSYNNGVLPVLPAFAAVCLWQCVCLCVWASLGCGQGHVRIQSLPPLWASVWAWIPCFVTCHICAEISGVVVSAWFASGTSFEARICICGGARFATCVAE